MSRAGMTGPGGQSAGAPGGAGGARRFGVSPDYPTVRVELSIG